MPKRRMHLWACLATILAINCTGSLVSEAVGFKFGMINAERKRARELKGRVTCKLTVSTDSAFPVISSPPGMNCREVCTVDFPIDAQVEIRTTAHNMRFCVAMKCPVSGASINLYALNTDGSKGALLAVNRKSFSCWRDDETGVIYGPGPCKVKMGKDIKIDVNGSTDLPSVTASLGELVLSVPAPMAGPFLVEAAGGGSVTPSGTILGSSDVLTAAVPAGMREVAVTPLTHIAAVRARTMAANGVGLATAVEAANAAVAHQYGISDILGFFPTCADSCSSVETAVYDARVYSLVLWAFDNAASSLGARTFDLANAIASDASDGIIDGLNTGAAIQVPRIGGGSVTLASTTGVADIRTALAAVLASADNCTQIYQAGFPTQSQAIGLCGARGGFYAMPAVLPPWTSGKPGTVSLNGSPYSWTMKTGSVLPAWLTFTPPNRLSGTAPVLTGGTIKTSSGPFTMIANDGSGNTCEVDMWADVLLPPPTLSLTAPPPIETCTGQGLATSLNVMPSGGAMWSGCSYHYGGGSIIEPLPPGMWIDPGTGSLKGCPAVPGDWRFCVFVYDCIGQRGKSCTITHVVPPGGQVTWDSACGTFDGVYDCTVSTHTPAGDTGLDRATFTVSGCTIIASTNLTGTVSSNGTFTGQYCLFGAYGSVCSDWRDIWGVFSTTNTFVLSHDPGGSVDVTIVAKKR